MFPQSITTAAALAAVLATTASAQVDYSKLDYHGHYFRQEWTNQPLNVQRLDPILNPGQLSPHVHSFIGASVISANTTFADTQEASCSQVYVKPDKSVYWMPSLYFQNPQNQSFIRVPEHHRVMYYFNRASDPKTGAQDFNLIEEFPPNFRMIAGDSMLRSAAATSQLQTAVEWFCHGPDVKSSGFPAGFTSCANGLAGSIHFPYCWNGQDFSMSAPMDHMSYPVGDHADSGACPSTHPHVLPHIFIEFWFDVSSFNGLYGAGDTPWVLSNGDPTGYSFHADFLNGWTPGVLGNAMKTCNIGESGEPLSNCFEVNTDAERNACSQPAIVDEKVDGWLSALPGCNPIQKGPQRATPVSNCNINPTINGKAVASAASSASVNASTATAGSKSSGVGSSTSGNAAKAVYSGVQSAVAPVASAVGSLTGGSAAAVPASVASGSSTSNGGSAANAAAPAASDSIETISSGSNSVPSSASSKSSGSSTSSNSNSGSDDHGSAPSAASLTLPASWVSAGCYSDAVTPRSLSGEMLAWWGEKITATGCANHCATKGFSISGVEFGQQCFCGNSLVQSKKVDDAQCAMPCVGAAGQMCGGAGLLNVYTKGGLNPLSAAASAVPAPATLSSVTNPVSKSSAAPAVPVVSSPVAYSNSKSSAAPATPLAASPAADAGSQSSAAESNSTTEPPTTPVAYPVAGLEPEKSETATSAPEDASNAEPAETPAYARRHVGGGAIVRT